MGDTKFHYHKDMSKVTETKQKFLRKQVIKLKSIPQPEQKSKEWYDFRDLRITASDFGYALNKEADVLKKKVILDRTFFTGNAIKWGIKYEKIALLIYEHRNNVKVGEFGCISHPIHDFLGASPDGITDDGVMVEIKCPYTRIISGTPSYEYWCQVQGQLEVCELDRCDFLECKLSEYSREEYLEDNYNGDYFYNSNGMEKGTLLEFFNVSEKKNFYIYMPIGMSIEEIDKFAINEKKKFENDSNIIYCGIDYWKLDKVSCIPIYRNQEWWNDVALPSLTNLWNTILHFRKEGIDAMNNYILNLKNNIPKSIPKYPRKSIKNETLLYKSTNITDFFSASTNDNHILVDNEYIDISNFEIFKNNSNQIEDLEEEDEDKIDFNNMIVFKNDFKKSAKINSEPEFDYNSLVSFKNTNTFKPIYHKIQTVEIFKNTKKKNVENIDLTSIF